MENYDLWVKNLVGSLELLGVYFRVLFYIIVKIFGRGVLDSCILISFLVIFVRKFENFRVELWVRV